MFKLNKVKDCKQVSVPISLPNEDNFYNASKVFRKFHNRNNSLPEINQLQKSLDS